jgi:hypothetical protein
VGQKMPKREKGKGEARWQARTYCNLGTVCGSPVFAVSPFAFKENFRVVRQKRGDVTPLTPRSALKAFPPFPFSPFRF